MRAGSSGLDSDATYFTTEYGRGMVGVPATPAEVPEGSSPRTDRTGRSRLDVHGVRGRGPGRSVMGLLVLAASAALVVRVYTLSGAEPSFWVDADSMISDGVTVPWTSIRRVERTRITGPLRGAAKSRRREPET